MEVLKTDNVTQWFNGRRYRLHKNQRYYKTSIKKKNVYLHRAVWEYHNGAIPEGLMIDHIDRDRSNNNISNLRLVTPKGNRANISDEHKEMYRQRMINYNSQQSGKWWQDKERSAKRAENLSKSWANRPMIAKVCLLCSKGFEAKHNSAVYCSKECRQENYFRRGVKQWVQKAK